MIILTGDMVRWISDWHVYSADANGVSVNGEIPIYSYGIVLECYIESRILVVFCNQSQARKLINLELMDIDVVSRGKSQRERDLWERK